MDNVFAVTSGKGGVGKTTTAINLAVAIGSEEPPVVVVDADLGMPDVGTFLDLDPARTLHDVLSGDASIESALSEIAPGVDALVGSRDLGSFPDADPDELESVIDQLAEQYASVFIDTGGGLSYEAVLPLELADAVVLVTSPQPAAIDNTKKSKQLADRVGVPVSGVVVTHSNERTDPAAIAEEIGVSLLGSVPADPIISESTERCQSLFEYAADSEATEAYRRIAAAVVEETEESSTRTTTTDFDPDLTDSSSPNHDSDGEREQHSDVDSEHSHDHFEEIDAPTDDSSPDPELSDSEESRESDSSGKSDETEGADEDDEVEDVADVEKPDEATDVEQSDDVDEVENSAEDDHSAGTSERDEPDGSAASDSTEETDETTEQPNDTDSASDQDTESTETKRSGGFVSRLFGWLR